jgi:hypothetical protein
VEWQSAIDRAYLRFVRSDGRRLTDDEKRKTTIIAKVDKNCTLLNVNLGPALQQIVNTLVSKMLPTEIVITVLGLGVIAVVPLVTKQYFSAQAKRAKKEKQLETQVAMFEQDTKRVKIITDAMSARPGLIETAKDF